MSREKGGCWFKFGRCPGRLKNKVNPNLREVGGATSIGSVGVIGRGVVEIALENIKKLFLAI